MPKFTFKPPAKDSKKKTEPWIERHVITPRMERALEALDDPDETTGTLPQSDSSKTGFSREERRDKLFIALQGEEYEPSKELGRLRKAALAAMKSTTTPPSTERPTTSTKAPKDGS